MLDLSPPTGIEPESLALEAPSLNHRTTGEAPTRLLFLIKASMLQGLVSGDPVSSELDPWQAGRSQRSDVWKSWLEKRLPPATERIASAGTYRYLSNSGEYFDLALKITWNDKKKTKTKTKK